MFRFIRNAVPLARVLPTLDLSCEQRGVRGNTTSPGDVAQAHLLLKLQQGQEVNLRNITRTFSIPKRISKKMFVTVDFH